MEPCGKVGFSVDFFFFFLVLQCLPDNYIFCYVFLRCSENKLIILSPFVLKAIRILQLCVQSAV